MKKLLPLFLFCIVASFVYAQVPQAEIYNPSIPFIQNSPEWGFDYLVSPSEPLGRPSIAYLGSSNTIYASIPDTNILANKCIVVLKSTNNGANWSIQGSISPASVVPKTKMVVKGDSLYCVFLYNSSVYVWNVLTNVLNAFTAYTNIRDFDVTISSSASLYLIIDLIGNNQVRLFGSNDGGASWAYTNYLSSTAAHPQIFMSGTGDTAIINYYGVTIAPDTVSSAIRSVRYRESTPGSMLIVGGFSTPIVAGIPKPQFKGVMTHGKAWVLYSSGTTGNIDLFGISSVDNGTTFGTPFPIGSEVNRDEYWFDIVNYNSGVDLIFYSDTLQPGSPTPLTDRLMYSYASHSMPENFSVPVRISQRPPGWSEFGYIPSVAEYRDATNDLGVIWVGNDGANRKVYFDRYSAITRITNNETEVPDDYSLGQNYPNPFNPQTKIDFKIAEPGFVSIKLYNINGKEISSIVNQTLQKGAYTVNFNGSTLSTGVYFYKLISGSFTASRKMTLIK